MFLQIYIKSIKSFREHWNSSGGYRELLHIAVPLIISSGSWSLQQFVNRIFLTWYSKDALAAAMPAGVLNFVFMSIFLGTAGYVSTFVAQYLGAGKKERVGPALWQGLYISVIGGIILLVFVPASGAIFRFINHAPQIQQYEIPYFKILCAGASPAIIGSAMGGVFSGLGRPWPVMWVNLLQTSVNIVLDYVLIFGNWGFRERGIAGAAIASVISAIVAVIVYAILLFRNPFNRQYNTVSGWRFDKMLFLRLIKFGLPGGMHFFLDIAGFTAFILFLGSLGTTALAASNIAFNVNTLAFMPMIGLGTAVSVLVGKYLGNNTPFLAEKSAYSGLHISTAYMSIIGACYLFLPGMFLYPFSAGTDPKAFTEISALVVVLLRFVALYSLFDSLTIIFSSALRGAGDTRFVMFVIGIVSLCALIIPSYFSIIVFGKGIYAAWIIVTVYIVLLGLLLFMRFFYGKWKTMRVIEAVHPVLPPRLPESPLGDV